MHVYRMNALECKCICSNDVHIGKMNSEKTAYNLLIYRVLSFQDYARIPTMSGDVVRQVPQCI